MDDPKGRIIYPVVLGLGLLLTVYPWIRSSKTDQNWVRVVVCLLGAFVIAWTACGVISDTSSLSVRLPEGGKFVLTAIRQFLAGICTGILLCLGISGNLGLWRRRGD